MPPAQIDVRRAVELRNTPRNKWCLTTPWKTVAYILSKERRRRVPFRAQSVQAAVLRRAK